MFYQFRMWLVQKLINNQEDFLKEVFAFYYKEEPETPQQVSQLKEQPENALTSIQKVVELQQKNLQSIEQISNEDNSQVAKSIESIEWNILYRNAHDGGANSVLASNVLVKSKSLLDTGETRVKDMLNVVVNLQSDARALADISKYINEIIRKSNIVSINLMIESSRLGQAGGAISVIAKEMQTLYSDMKKITIDIDSRISAVGRGSQKNEVVCKNVGQMFFGINAELEQFQFLMNRVSELATTQAQKLREIESQLKSNIETKQLKVG